jgi:hypothetical protein
MVRAPCSVDGCEKESRGRGWCGTHWLRWRKYGDPTFVKKPGVDYMIKGVCSIEDCGRPAHAHTYCHRHLYHYKRHGDPLHTPKITGRPWKGDQPTWAAVHKRLYRMLGPAVRFTCVDCGRGAEEWSYDGLDHAQLWEDQGRRSPIAYSTDPARYVPRCVPCHRRHDWPIAPPRERRLDGTFV